MIADDHIARQGIEELLETMLASDSYAGVIRAWPPDGSGHAKIEIVALAGACEDCLVPKNVLVMVLADNLPAGVTVEEADLIYPADVAA
jgi:hypothetical protein